MADSWAPQTAALLAERWVVLSDLTWVVYLAVLLADSMAVQLAEM